MTLYEFITCIVSIIALGISIATYIWTIKYRGELEWHFTPHFKIPSYFVCTIINSGQKPITPLAINIITETGNPHLFTPDEGDKAIKKLLQPGEILQLSFSPTAEILASLLTAKDLVLIDAYERTFPLDRKEFANIQKSITTQH